MRRPTQRIFFVSAISIPLLLGACAKNTFVIDAGCAMWRSHDVRPSRSDTPATIDGLIVQREAMAAVCAP
mgnify:CR=1 FL=1